MQDEEEEESLYWQALTIGKDRSGNFKQHVSDEQSKVVSAHEPQSFPFIHAVT